MRTRIKICGITKPDDARMIVDSGIDAIGLVFYPKSPRAVDITTAAEICSLLPALVASVAVFVNAKPDEIERVLLNMPITLLQFHGNESPKFCNGFGIPFIKTLRMADAADPEMYARSYPQAGALLLDTYESERYGGTGLAFSWERAKQCHSSPVIIAGGIKAINVSAALTKSGAYAVDVSSGVETSPGQKNTEKIQSFICAVRDHDQMQTHKREADWP